MEYGSARFERASNNKRQLRLEYRTPELQVTLDGRSLAAGVDAACASEIAAMRATMTALGTELVGQLDDRGLNPIINRQWQSDDERDWLDDGSEIRVRGSRVTISENIAAAAEVSDAKLVQETVRLMIEQRERNIGQLYRTILADMEGSRLKKQHGWQSDSMLTDAEFENPEEVGQ